MGLFAKIGSTWITRSGDLAYVECLLHDRLKLRINGESSSCTVKMDTGKRFPDIDSLYDLMEEYKPEGGKMLKLEELVPGKSYTLGNEGLEPCRFIGLDAVGGAVFETKGRVLFRSSRKEGFVLHLKEVKMWMNIYHQGEVRPGNAFFATMEEAEKIAGTNRKTFVKTVSVMVPEFE